MNKLKKFFAVSLVTGAFLVPALVVVPSIKIAVAFDVPGSGSDLAGTGIDSPETLIEKIINYTLTILAGIAVLFIIWGGFQYILGGEDGVKKAKPILTSAIVGLIIILLAWAAVNWIVGLFLS